MKYIIGFDDHDSPAGGCTTHFSFLISKQFEREGIRVIGYPRLTRLNPNIPWKTRGNASISIVIESDREKSDILDMVWNASIEYVKEVSRGFAFKRSPGVAIAERSNEILENFYWKAVTDVVTNDYAAKVSERLGILARGGRGIIGAIASIGFKGGRVYELLTYRKREYWEKRRTINPNQLIKYDETFFPMVYANFDYVDMEPLIMSHGKDPVLYGLRGIDPSILIQGMKMIQANEDMEGYLIFNTNQGSDDHFRISKARPYNSFIGEAKVDSVKVVQGGDCIIFAQNNVIVVYKETGELNQAARELLPGDIIRVYGAVKPSSGYGVIIEPEKMEVLELKKTKLNK